MPGGNGHIGRETADEIVALRETWHTRNHPIYVEFAEGRIGLEPHGRLMAQHYQHVSRLVPALGLMYYKAGPEARPFILDNFAEEHGLAAGPGEDREAQDHMELILRFCRAAGLSDEAVFATEQLASWRARSYFYLNVIHDEPIGVVMALGATQEGQQPGVNRLILPAFERHHGFAPDAPELEFFREHLVADADHSRRQITLVAELIDSPTLRKKALEVAEIAVKTRWACMNELYRTAVLGEKDPLPEGVAA